MTTKCGICKEHKLEGMQFLDSYLCVDCEQEMVAIHPNHPDYSLLIGRMKMIWNYNKKSIKM